MSTADIIQNSLLILGLGIMAGSYTLEKRAQRNFRRTAASGRKRCVVGFWPRLWMIVKTENQALVQSVLGLRNARPCSWSEGVAGSSGLFVARPIKGWTLVLGAALPDPSEDVDACFRLVRGLSARFGQVQLFYANTFLRHHAWIKARRGRILRAYSWAGKTLWNQGTTTPEEISLCLRCFDYTEAPDRIGDRENDVLENNSEKVPQLAACWGLDPAEFESLVLEGQCGITGVPFPET